MLGEHLAGYWPGINKSKYMLENTEKHAELPSSSNQSGKGSNVKVEDRKVSKYVKHLNRGRSG